MYYKLRQAIRSFHHEFPAKHVWKQSNNRNHFDIFISGQMVRVVYNSSIGELVTALPKNGIKMRSDYE